jgi:osmotically inducible lipoprotein OsmB
MPRVPAHFARRDARISPAGIPVRAWPLGNIGGGAAIPFDLVTPEWRRRPCAGWRRRAEFASRRRPGMEARLRSIVLKARARGSNGRTMDMDIKSASIALLAVLLLAACGQTRTERAITGAAGGAVLGEVVADEPLAGAGIGAAAGVLRP